MTQYTQTEVLRISTDMGSVSWSCNGWHQNGCSSSNQHTAPNPFPKM